MASETTWNPGSTLAGFTELTQYEIDPAVAPLLPMEFCLERSVAILGKLPTDVRAPLTLGMLHARDAALIAELGQRLDRTIKPVQLNAFEVRSAIRRIFGVRLEEEAPGQVLSLDYRRRIDFAPDQSQSKMLDDLLSTAVRRRATDIHLEIYYDDVDLRFRIDGVLYQITTPVSPDNFNKVVSRIKVLCSVDLAERRRAQDGRFSAFFDDGTGKRRVDFRVSVVPGGYGQDVVIRILDPSRFILDLDQLTMEPGMLGRFKRLIHYPGGLVLTTGPTGSGKTTTLYASIQTLKGTNLKVMTVEDPVEFEFPKVNQKNVTEFMSFPDYLKSFLRQNPDVILVGEIRDSETAEVAVRAATTGHLVLSTLHTRDAVGAIARLRTLGISDDYIANVLIGALGQRLVRRCCSECLGEYEPNPELVRLYFGPTSPSAFRKGQGCERCSGTGYRGMVGVYELFEPTPEVAALIGQGRAVEEIRAAAVANGFRLLVEDAVRKIQDGVTTVEEVARRVEPKYLR